MSECGLLGAAIILLGNFLVILSLGKRLVPSPRIPVIHSYVFLGVDGGIDSNGGLIMHSDDVV